MTSFNKNLKYINKSVDFFMKIYFEPTPIVEIIREILSSFLKMFAFTTDILKHTKTRLVKAHFLFTNLVPIFLPLPT